MEGRSPNLFVTAQIAAITGEKSSYIRYRAFDKKYYKEMVIELIKKFDSASRQDIDRLLLSKLPDILDEKQKLKKINNLLYEMSRKDKTIRNSGTKRTPVWVLT